MTKVFKIIATLEGISLLLLFFVAMPLKYLYNTPEYVRPIGSAHGGLFIAYIILAFLLKEQQNWPVKKFLLVCVASVIPFGTFYIEYKYFREPQKN